MTCQHGCIELCKACRCCFYHKLVLRRSKWCFYSHVFNTKRRPLPLVAARSSCVFFSLFFFFAACFRIVPAVLASQHSCSHAGMRSRWYVFPLRSGSSGDEGFLLHLHRHPNVWAAAWIKVFHLWYLMRMERTPRFVLANQGRWDVWQVANRKDRHQKTLLPVRTRYFRNVNSKQFESCRTWLRFFMVTDRFYNLLHFSGPFLVRDWPSRCGCAGGSFRVGAAQI